jgi:hypothetical protein
MEIPKSNRIGECPRGVPLNWLILNFCESPAGADQETVKKHLFMYLFYIFSIMFPLSHGDIVLPSLIKIVEKIVDAPLPSNLIYNFGYAMIVDICRGCVTVPRKENTTKGHMLVVCYEFLQLWLCEYLPLGCPQIVNTIHPYNSR